MRALLVTYPCLLGVCIASGVQCEQFWHKCKTQWHGHTRKLPALRPSSAPGLDPPSPGMPAQRGRLSGGGLQARKAKVKGNQRPKRKKGNQGCKTRLQGGPQKLPAYVYGRVSSQKQLDQQGLNRQKSVCLPLAKRAKPLGAPKVRSEVVSGSLPLEKRKMLQGLLTGCPKQVFVESARAIARSAVVGEQGTRWARSTASKSSQVTSPISSLFTRSLAKSS